MLGKKIDKSLWLLIYFLIFLLSIILLEYFGVNLTPDGIFKVLSVILPMLITLMAFFAVIALFRLEGLRSQEKNESNKSASGEIRSELSKVCTRVIFFIFLYLGFLFWSVFTKSQHLHFKLEIHIDTAMIGVLIVFLIYILKSTISFVREENLKPKSDE